MKKALIALLMVFASFTLFGCGKIKELKLEDIVNKAYLEAVFKNKTEIVNPIKKLDELNDTKFFYSQNNQIVFKTLNQPEDKTTFYIINSKGLRVDLKDYKYSNNHSIFYHQEYIRILDVSNPANKKDIIYSALDGSKLFEFNQFEEIDGQNVEYKYTFAEKQITIEAEDISFRRIIYFEDLQVVDFPTNELTSYYEEESGLYRYYENNQLYDLITYHKKQTALKYEVFKLANKDLLFQEIEKVEQQPGKKITELDFDFRDPDLAPHLFRYTQYIYNYKSKRLTKVKLPFMVKGVIANTVDKETNLKPYVNKIQNLAKITPINKDSKLIEYDQVVNLSNKLNITYAIQNYTKLVYTSKDSFYYENSYPKMIQTFKKGNHYFSGSDIYQILKNSGEFLLKNPNEPGYTENGYTREVKIYNVDKDSFTLENMYFVQKISCFGDYSIILRDKENKFFLYANGELKPLNGNKITSFPVSKTYVRLEDDNKFYYYTSAGDLIVELPKNYNIMDDFGVYRDRKEGNKEISTYIFHLRYKNDKNEEKSETFTYSYISNPAFLEFNFFN